MQASWRDRRYAAAPRSAAIQAASDKDQKASSALTMGRESCRQYDTDKTAARRGCTKYAWRAAERDFSCKREDDLSKMQSGVQMDLRALMDTCQHSISHNASRQNRTCFNQKSQTYRNAGGSRGTIPVLRSIALASTVNSFPSGKLTLFGMASKGFSFIITPALRWWPGDLYLQSCHCAIKSEDSFA